MLGLGNSLTYAAAPGGYVNTHSMVFDGDHSGGGGGDYLRSAINLQTIMRTGNFSITAWVRFTDGRRNPPQTIMGARSDSGNWFNFINSKISGKLGFSIKANSDQCDTFSDSAVFVDGQTDWHHVAVTVQTAGLSSSESVITLYVDGDAVPSTTNPAITRANLELLDMSSQTEFGVGAFIAAGTPSDNLGGEIDELTVFSTNLSPPQIDQMYAATDLEEEFASNASLLSRFDGWWKFDNTLGNSRDPGGNDMIIVNNAAFSTDVHS